MPFSIITNISAFFSCAQYSSTSLLSLFLSVSFHISVPKNLNYSSTTQCLNPYKNFGDSFFHFCNYLNMTKISVHPSTAPLLFMFLMLSSFVVYNFTIYIDDNKRYHLNILPFIIFNHQIKLILQIISIHIS